MRLSKLKIENFRGIECTEVELDRDATVLIGENNSGKTSVLEALRLGLGACRSNVLPEAKCPRFLGCSSFDSGITRTHS